MDLDDVKQIHFGDEGLHVGETYFADQLGTNQSPHVS